MSASLISRLQMLANVEGGGAVADALEEASAALETLEGALEYVRANLGDPVPVGRRHVARRVDAALAKARGDA